MALGKLKDKKGQKWEKCNIVGCDELGRVLARLGTVEIVYCARHRKKYGERVINALINARFNYKLTNFLSSIKQDLFMNPNSHLCDICRGKEKVYINSKTEELRDLMNMAEEHDITELNSNDKELNELKVEDGD